MSLEIKYGSREGKNFTEWRFGVLKELLHEIVLLKRNPQNIIMWYDKGDDYHRVSFDLNGEKIEVRFYKVFGCSLNGETSHRTFMRSYTNSVARYLIDAEGRR